MLCVYKSQFSGRSLGGLTKIFMSGQGTAGYAVLKRILMQNYTTYIYFYGGRRLGDIFLKGGRKIMTNQK